MDEFQHADGVWTWNFDGRSRRAALWVPYLESIQRMKGKACWEITYNGGTFDADLSRVDGIMLYGACGNLPLEFLDDLSMHRVPLLIHRRNLTSPYLFLPTSGHDANDIVSAQIHARDHAIRRCHIARTLIRARFQAARPALPVSATAWQELARCRSIKRIRAWEAEEAKRFWAIYFDDLGVGGEHRREEGPLQAALDACCFFMYGVVLRWVLLHRLSPCHGFLHEPTDYAALIYDLIEPFRYLIEESTARAARRVLQRDGLSPDKLGKTLTEAALSELKAALDETVHVPATRQWVRRKNLVHGAVLALRAYLLGNMPRLVLPCEGSPKGGRPPKISYRLPGSRQQPLRRLPRTATTGAENEGAPVLTGVPGARTPRRMRNGGTRHPGSGEDVYG